MAGETVITVVGNLTADPELRRHGLLAERVERLAGSEASAYLFRS